MTVIFLKEIKKILFKRVRAVVKSIPSKKSDDPIIEKERKYDFNSEVHPNK